MSKTAGIDCLKVIASVFVVGMLVVACDSNSQTFQSSRMGYGGGHASCLKTVSFRYIEPEYQIETYRNDRSSGRRHHAQEQRHFGSTRSAGLTWHVEDLRRGCGSERRITVSHREPIQ